MSEERLEYVDYCKAHIVSELETLEGEIVYACDLAGMLTQDGRYNGTLTFSTHEAKELIKFWWDDLDEVNSRLYDELGYTHDQIDMFNRPELYHVAIVDEGINSILNDLDIIQDNWDDKIELTRDVIDTIVEQIDNVQEIRF